MKSIIEKILQAVAGQQTAAESNVIANQKQYGYEFVEMSWSC